MMKKIRNLCGTIFLGFCLWWLPNGNRMKDGASQQLARVTCAAFLLLLCMSDFSLRNRGNQTTLFFERYVGPASARSLAAMRISCSVLLLTFTSDHMTSPLAATAQVPRWMCRPTGIIRLLNECGVLGGLFEDARSLWRLGAAHTGSTRLRRDGSRDAHCCSMRFHTLAFLWRCVASVQHMAWTLLYRCMVDSGCFGMARWRCRRSFT